MAKALFEKSIRISEKPKKQGISASFVTGAKPTPVKKPKSLTPGTKKK